jgi:DNA-binding IclR family transcriptional regulator
MSTRAGSIPSTGSSTFAKMMDVVRFVGGSEAGAAFPQIARELELPKSTLHRLLQDLVQQRLLSQGDDRLYKLGHGLFELARLAWDRADIRREAQRSIAALVRDTNETVHLAILDGVDVVYIDKVEGSQTMRMASMIGARNPAYCTGVGKALIAFLPPDELKARYTHYNFRAFTPRTIASFRALNAALAEIRKRGYATDNEEHEVGIRCAAAPIFNFRGTAISSLSITVPVIRCDQKRLFELARRVQAAADEITERCGGRLA